MNVQAAKKAFDLVKENLPTFIALAKGIKEVWNDLKTPDLLTYADVVGYLAENQPKHFNVKKGACVLILDNPEKISAVVMFLDENNKLIDGVKMNAKVMDQELRETFAHKKLVIFE